MGNPLPLNLAQECRKAEKIIAEFVDPAHGGLDRVIPMPVLRRAQGFAIFTVARLGFLMSARAGSGIVVARLADDSWSPPSAMGLGGLGAGFNAGVDVTDFLIVLNSKQAVKTFMATGSLQLGGNMSVAVGPLGRAAEASGNLNSSGNLAAMFSYSKSKGLYGGVSVEGSVLVDRSDANSKAYHRNVTAKQILAGHVDLPGFAQPLISLIEKHTLTGDFGLGVDGYGRQDGQRDPWRNQRASNDSEYDTLDRELRRSRLSDRDSPSPYSSFDDDRDQSRGSIANNYGNGVGEYAFASGIGPTGRQSLPKSRMPSFGSRNSYGNTSARSTDYKNDEVDYEFDSRLTSGGRPTFSSRKSGADSSPGAFARAGVQYRPRHSPTNSFSAGPSTAYQNSSGQRNSSTSAAFPTQFYNNDSSTDDLQVDPSRGANDSPRVLDNVKDPFQDLVDLSDARQSKTSTASQRPTLHTSRSGRKAGFDDLDHELQGASTDEGHDYFASDAGLRGSNNNTPSAAKGWRADYGLPAEDYAAAPPPTRPQMHSRTSSAQKLWNRVRGNSQSKVASSASFAETWENRQRARDWERMNDESSSDRVGESYSARSPAANGSYGGRIDTSSTSPSQSRRNMRSTSPSIARALGASGTPPPAAVVAAALGRSQNTTPRAGSAHDDPFRQDGSGQNSLANDASEYDLSGLTVESQVVALFEFEGQEQDDLSFSRGDVIDILRKTNSREDWWLGKCRGKVGNLPANFTKDI